VLIKSYGALRMVSSDVDTKQKGDRTKISQLEAAGKLLDHCILGLPAWRDNGQIIYKDRNADLDPLLLPYIDALVTAHPGEAYLLKSKVKLLILHPGCLLQALERLPEPKDMARLALLKTVRLLHVNLLHQITIKCCLCDLACLLYVLWQPCGPVVHLCMAWKC
jgi:hypothetical protein